MIFAYLILALFNTILAKFLIRFMQKQNGQRDRKVTETNSESNFTGQCLIHMQLPRLQPSLTIYPQTITKAVKQYLV